SQKGKITARYTHGLGIDEPLVVKKKDNTHYYHADGLGSITVLSDKYGKVVQTYDYDAFGNMKKYEQKIKQPYTYTAREYDSEIKLYYYRARYYDAKVGRFISKDPIGFEGGINFYLYVGNNPVNLVDPTGLNAIAIAEGFLTKLEQYIARAGAFIAGLISGNEISKECKKANDCPPCIPPVGTIGYRYDLVPPSRPHKTYTGDHVHLYKMNQNPNNCQCFWQPIGVTAPPPPLGAIPL
ncbi:MAG: type IV secretion protein Rhs, partial [Nitrospirae bacterium]